MIDAASRGALMDKTPIATRNLINNMAGNTQQFGVREGASFKGLNEIATTKDNQRLENKISELTSLVRKLAIGQEHMKTCASTTLGCSICNSFEHPTEGCPTL
uniref:Uncharacterized protein n=1 Tax=Cajanus cajan TaxID=3821 RepID=A0A151UGI1_CAJCA